MSLKNFFKTKCRKWLLAMLVLSFILLAYETSSPRMSPNKFLRNTYVSDADLAVENDGKISSIQNVKIKMPNSQIITMIRDENDTDYKKHVAAERELYSFIVTIEQLEFDKKEPMFFARNYIIGKKIPISYIFIDAEIQSANIPKAVLKVAQEILIDFKNKGGIVTKSKYNQLNSLLTKLGLDKKQRAFLFLRFLKIPAKIEARPTSYSYATKNSDAFGSVLMIHIKADVVLIRSVEPK